MYIHKSNNPSIQQRLNLLIHIYFARLCNIQGSIRAVGFFLVGAGAFSLTGASTLTGTFSLIGAISMVLFVSLT
jgi:hypothetical protein